MNIHRIDRTALVVAGIVGPTVAAVRFRHWSQQWGAEPKEIAAVLPGDELIPNPFYLTTRAITIHATPAVVFAWLVQLGQGRGGFYTFDRLENLIGLNIHSVDRIVPELQRVKVGDIVPLSAIGGPAVVEIKGGARLVLRFLMDPFTGKPLKPGAASAARRFDWTWAFALAPINGTDTRLIVRTRANYAPRALIAALAAILVEPAHFIMEREMLRGIKRRAEAAIPTVFVSQLAA